MTQAPAAAILTRRLLKLLPWVSVQHGLANRRWVQGLCASEQSALIRLPGGARAYCDLSDSAGRSVFLFGAADAGVLRVVRRVVRRGDAMLDIGANHGQYALACAARVGSGGVVHAFEPQPHLAELIRRSAQANGFAHLHTHELALSDGDSERALHRSLEGSGAASLERAAVRAGGGELVVPARHAGRMLAELNLPHVRLVKIDVVGHEPAVISAAAEWLAQQTPDAILLKSTDSNIPFFRRLSVCELHRMGGYRFWEIARCAVGVQLQPIRPGEERATQSEHFLAVHDRADRGVYRRLGLRV